jgi:outer membrane protein TolC
MEQAWSRYPQVTALVARESEVQARAELAAGLTPAPPSLSLSNVNDRLSTDGGKDAWELELAVPLWMPGQRAARTHESDSAISALVAQRDALRLQLAGELREAWWALGAARQSVDQAKRREASARALEADVVRRYQAGELARVDANLAKAERLAAQGELLDAQSALRLAEQTYLLLTGVDAPRVLAEEAVAPVPDAGTGRVQLAQAQATAQLAMARLAVAQQTRRDAPELAIRAVRERGEFNTPYANSLGLKLTIPFSSAARVRQETAAAQAEVLQADAELALTRQRIAMDAARSRYQTEVAQQQVAQAQEGLDLAIDTLRLAEKSFAIGETDLPSLLRARSSAFEAQVLFNRQQTARAAGVSRLNQSLGVMP